jgi:acyl-coenzyme A synthetase/AMP-(fatty) acid ligase
MCLIQAKASANRTWAQTRRELKGAIDDAIGTGKPAALAVLDDDGEALFVGRLDDVVEMLSSGLQMSVSESSGEQRRRLASMPGILREE